MAYQTLTGTKYGEINQERWPFPNNSHLDARGMHNGICIKLSIWCQQYSLNVATK